jgi:hypothetical protein
MVSLRGTAMALAILTVVASAGCGILDEIDPQCDPPHRLTGLDPPALVGTYHGKPGSALTLNADMTAAINLPRSLEDLNLHTRTDLSGAGTWTLWSQDTSQLVLTIGDSVYYTAKIGGTATSPIIFYGDGAGGCDRNDMTRDGPSPSAT